MTTPRAQLRIFHDRRDAERALAAAVKALELEAPVVLGLPRGGVPVAYEVARVAALSAAADAGDRVRAVVSRGGRPDLAAERLPEVTAPVLLIVARLAAGWFTRHLDQQRTA